MISKELDQLIQSYLSDGVISDKERQVLLRKAEKMGLDVDEVDLYIDAQQQISDQLVDTAVKMKRGTTCPFCGGPVPQLTDKCPHCGQFITPEASQELQEILEALEEALVDFKSSKDPERSKAKVERYVRKAKLYYSNNPKIKLILSEIDDEIKVAGTRIKRTKFIKHTFKNVYFWLGISVTCFIVLLVIGVIFEEKWADTLASIPLFSSLGLFSAAIIKKYGKRR